MWLWVILKYERHLEWSLIDSMGLQMTVGFNSMMEMKTTMWFSEVCYNWGTLVRHLLKCFIWIWPFSWVGLVAPLTITNVARNINVEICEVGPNMNFIKGISSLGECLWEDNKVLLWCWVGVGGIRHTRI